MRYLLAILMSITFIFPPMLYADCHNPLLHIDTLRGDQEVEEPAETEGQEQCQREKSHRPKPILPKGKCPHCETDTTAWGDCWNPNCEYYGKPVI